MCQPIQPLMPCGGSSLANIDAESLRSEDNVVDNSLVSIADEEIANNDITEKSLEDNHTESYEGSWRGSSVSVQTGRTISFNLFGTSEPEPRANDGGDGLAGGGEYEAEEPSSWRSSHTGRTINFSNLFGWSSIESISTERQLTPDHTTIPVHSHGIHSLESQSSEETTTTTNKNNRQSKSELQSASSLSSSASETDSTVGTDTGSAKERRHPE